MPRQHRRDHPHHPSHSYAPHAFPEAWIEALVNSYNARVLKANPDIDDILVYTKARRRGSARYPAHQAAK